MICRVEKGGFSGSGAHAWVEAANRRTDPRNPPFICALCPRSGDVPYLLLEMSEPEEMIPNVLSLISQAIKQKHCIALRYHDQRQIRVVEPHAVYTDERGELVLDGYQTRGHSASGRPPPFWRPFRLKKVTAVSVLKENFEPRVSEGFSANRLKYRSGLVAIVQDARPAFGYVPPAQTTEVGPHLPQGTRR